MVFLFSTTLHEAGHALAALKLGDPTAYEGGQVSLNPIPHIRRAPIGMVLVPIVSFIAEPLDDGLGERPLRSALGPPLPEAGGADGSRRSGGQPPAGDRGGAADPRRDLAGVFYAPDSANFTAVTAAAAGSWAAGAVTPLSILFSLNLLLFTFNLLPLPPLDGSAILPGFMGDDMAAALPQPPAPADVLDDRPAGGVADLPRHLRSPADAGAQPPLSGAGYH